jgi:hypothetical protein
MIIQRAKKVGSYIKVQFTSRKVLSGGTICSKRKLYYQMTEEPFSLKHSFYQHVELLPLQIW